MAGVGLPESHATLRSLLPVQEAPRRDAVVLGPSQPTREEDVTQPAPFVERMDMSCRECGNRHVCSGGRTHTCLACGASWTPRDYYTAGVCEHDASTAHGKPQPDPKPNNNPAIIDLVVAEFMARDRLGRERYGTRLQAGNGRDALRDALDEALDLVQYLRQAIFDRDGR